MTGAFFSVGSRFNREHRAYGSLYTRRVYRPRTNGNNRPYDGLERRHYVEHLCLSSWNETSRIQQGRNRELDL